MAYLALYRKYRPRAFSEVISQPHITVTLRNQIKSGQIGHAYLFTGSRGTGKTTCAKILAKAVNCTNPVDGNPCFECDNCVASDESPDVQEIDAASNNGVEDIRSLREEAGYLPSELKYKVYIIDEVHMLSASAFNALLKTLEEPPPHVIFILATTEIHKLPLTVKSRCQQYEFNRINAEESAAALTEIARKEGVTLEKDAALLISRLSDGGMRDALSLLDVAATENSVITQQTIRDCAGIAGNEHLFAITDAVADGDGKSALTTASELYAKSKDPARLIDELLQHFRNLMIVRVMNGDFSLLNDVLKEEQEQYRQQAERFTVEQIMDCLDKLEDCLRLKGRKVESEICLMRLAVGFGKPERVDKIEVKPEIKPVPKAETKPVPIPPIPPVPEIKSEPAVLKVESPRGIKKSGRGFPQWQAVLEKLDVFKAAMLEDAVADLSADSGNTVIVGGNENLGFFFDNPDNTAAIEKAAREATGINYKVVYVAAEVSSSEMSETPSAPIPEAPPTPKIEQFLTQALALGVPITVKV